MSKSEEKQRIFIALPLPQQIKQELQQWQKQHQSTIPFRKWTHPEDLHITLQFLGDTAYDQLQQLISLLGSIEHSKFQLQLSHLGSFGPVAAPRILWAAVKGDLQLLNDLHKKVITQTEKTGFVTENRKFQPHITLARYYDERRQVLNDRSLDANLTLQQILQDNPPTTLQWEVNEFTIMKTTLNKQPSYSVLHRFSL